jgi:hypothetical protein
MPATQWSNKALMISKEVPEMQKHDLYQRKDTHILLKRLDVLFISGRAMSLPSNQTIS